jgi:hypothetical protein
MMAVEEAFPVPASGETFLPSGSLDTFDGSMAMVSKDVLQERSGETLLPAEAAPSEEALLPRAMPSSLSGSLAPDEGGVKLLLAGGGILGIGALAVALLFVGGGLLTVAWVMMRDAEVVTKEVIREVPTEVRVEVPGEPVTVVKTITKSATQSTAPAPALPASGGNPAVVAAAADEPEEPTEPGEPNEAVEPNKVEPGDSDASDSDEPSESDEPAEPAVAEVDLPEPKTEPERRAAPIERRGFDVPLPADLDPNVVTYASRRSASLTKYVSDTEAIWALGRVVMTDPSVDVRGRAWAVVKGRWERGGLGHAPEHEQIANYLIRNGSPDLKRDALSIVAYKSTDHRAIAKALGDKDLNVRRAATTAMKTFGEKNPQGRPAAKQALAAQAKVETDTGLARRMRSIAGSL